MGCRVHHYLNTEMKVTLLAVVTLTTVASLVGAADPECVYRKLRGLSPHWPKPTSCSSYYRCSKGLVRSVNCPANKEYNAKTGKCGARGRGLCNLSLAAPLTEPTNVCANEANGVYVAKTGYCGEFYICDEQMAYPQDCPAGSYFNQATSACEPDPTSECWQNLCINQENGVFVQNSLLCASYYVCGDKQAIPQTCPKGSYFDQTYRACTVDEGYTHCWENYCIGKTDGEYISDKSNTAAFYICDGGEAIQQYCPEGSYFNQQLLSCLPGSGPTTPEEPCDEETTTPAEPCDEETTTISPIGCDCSNGVKHGEMVPDLDNCRQYELCIDGELIVGDCGEKNFFNPLSNVCEPDTNNQCPESSCPTECTDDEISVYVPNCAQFKVCQSGAWQVVDCPPGAYFNTQLSICVKDTDHVCLDECIATDLPTMTDSCWQYQACIDSKWQLESCGKGYYFDGFKHICLLDETNECPENKALSARSKRSVEDNCNCTEGTMVAHPTDCDKYLICENGVEVEGTCGVGNLFKNCSGICAPDTAGTCWVCGRQPNGALLPNPDNCTGYLTCSNGLAIPSTCPSDEWFNGVECEVDVTGQCINPCTACSTGNVAHPICSKYYQCTNGVAQVVDCAAGQGFDPATKKCSSSVTCTAALCATAAEGTTYPVTGDSSKFYVCLDKEATIRSCPANSAYDTTFKLCLAQPSCSCNQAKCKGAPEDLTFPSLSADNSTYCICRDGDAYLNSCSSGYVYDEVVNVCTFTGPCDPASCADHEEYWISPNYQDPDGFCVCRVGQPAPVLCPIGYTFDVTELLCVEIKQPDPRCCRNYCVGKENYLPFPSLDGNSGFCLCLDEIPEYHECPKNTTYDTLLGFCLATEDDIVCDPTGCKATECDSVPDYTIFPATNSTAAFCYCKNDCPVWFQCPANTIYDQTLKLCLNEAEPEDPCVSSVCNATKCDTQPEYEPFPAENGTLGFCYCVDYKPNYRACEDGTEYNILLELCLPPPVTEDPCVASVCNAAKCDVVPEYEPFKAENGTLGFCYCVNDVPIYRSCEINTEFNDYFKLCLAPPVTEDPCLPKVCDAAKCDEVPEFQPFEAENGTQGFCYCMNYVPIYRDCEPGTEFDKNIKICLDPVQNECTSSYCDASKCSCLAEYKPFPSSKEDDASGFCLCVKGEPVYDTCPEGTVFDSKEEVCLMPEAPCSVCEPGKCASLSEDATFAALNTTFGFCDCINGAAVYKNCPPKVEYDPVLNLCLPSTAKLSELSVCDVTQCHVRGLFTRFSARNTTNGFCSCTAVDRAIYQNCEDEHHFDDGLGSCIISACDSVQCRNRIAFEPFAAKNTTKGFCSCDGLAVYHHCTEGHVFDVIDGVCILENIVANVACNQEDCSARLQFEPFAARNTTAGFCSCDDTDVKTVSYHACPRGELYITELGMCLGNNHVIQKRSVETEEKLPCITDEKRSVPANCSQYEICLEGNWRRRTCSDLRYYNPEQQRCLEPRDDMVCSYSRVTHLPPCNNQTETLTLPARGTNCHQYFRCAGDKWRLRNCPKQHYYATHIGTCLPLPKDLDQDEFCLQMFNHTVAQVTEYCKHLSVRPSSSGCASFLMCLDNAWWLQQCPLQMYFSREHNYCLPNDAQQCVSDQDRTNSSCSSGQRRGVVGSCRSYELCTLAGHWVRHSCSEEQQFEPMFGCVTSDGNCHANGVRRICSSGELRALPINSKGGDNCTQFFHYCEKDEWQLGSCLRGYTFAKQLQKCVPQEECGLGMKVKSLKEDCANQADGVSVPDVEDCTRFYLCLQQQPAILQSCSNGSFYDPKLGYCRPNDGSCHLAVCEGLEEGALVPHPRDCRAYYSCFTVNGTQLIYCPEGQYFDQPLKQCRVDHGQCQGKTSSVKPDTSPNRCLGLHGVSLQHELYCNLYYVCVKGLAIPVECPKNQQFNPVLEHCEPQEQALQQCPNGTWDVNGTTPHYSCGSLPDGFYLANRTDCTRYFICAQGVALPQRCGTGNYFDAQQLLCVPDDGSCPFVDENEEQGNNQHLPPDPLVCEGQHGLIMPDPQNCNNFYICISSKLRLECCYTGHFFNVSRLQCQAYELPPENEQTLNQTAATPGEMVCSDAPTNFTQICQVIGVGSSVAEQGDCRRYTSCEGNEPISQRCRNGESFDSLLGICRQNDGTCLMENGVRVGVCNGKHGQLVRDADKCNGYFVCVHGQKIEGECQQGDYFNKVTNVCEQDVEQQCIQSMADESSKMQE